MTTYDELDKRLEQAERLYQEANDEAIRLHNLLLEATKYAEAMERDRDWALREMEQRDAR